MPSLYMPHHPLCLCRKDPFAPHSGRSVYFAMITAEQRQQASCQSSNVEEEIKLYLGEMMQRRAGSTNKNSSLSHPTALVHTSACAPKLQCSMPITSPKAQVVYTITEPMAIPSIPKASAPPQVLPVLVQPMIIPTVISPTIQNVPMVVVTQPAKKKRRMRPTIRTVRLLGQRHRTKKDGYIDVSGVSAAPRPGNFMTLVHTLLTKTEHPKVWTWLPHGRGFQVHNRYAVISLLSQETGLQRFKQFLGGLHVYGVEPLQNTDCFYHELFLRGRPELASYMEPIEERQTPSRRYPDPKFEKFPVMPRL